MKKFIVLFMCAFIALTPFELSAQNPNTSDAVRVAKAFCTAVYRNDMSSAKSYMHPDDARRTPNIIRGVDLDACKENFRKSSYKVIPSGLSDEIITVRFYDPTQTYPSKQNRWFCCSVQLVHTTSGWLVTQYGY